VTTGWDKGRALADGAACLEAALQYLRRGWSVVPLCPPDHVGVGRKHGEDCQSPGKGSLIRWQEYQTRRPAADDVRHWWRLWPNANVGVVLGAVSGLIGLDLDGPAGERSLFDLSGGDLPDTLEFSTPGGGRRLLYVLPDGVELRNAAVGHGAHQELRLLATNYYTVAPPSRHANGGLYEWVRY
jgi:hypothetical protein